MEDVNQHLIDDPEKLSVIGRFSGRVAHEFNNLLTPLLAYPDILRSMFDPADGDGQELVDVMATAAAELARMTRQMTQLSLGDTVLSSQHTFAMKDAWKSAVEPLANDFGDLSKRIVLDFPADLPKASGRADTVCHAIESVVRNALEATESDGIPVKLTARVENLPARTTRFGRQTGPWSAVVLSVEDAGPGIPSPVQNTLFEPFITSKKVDGKRRLGVGLTVTYRVLRSVDGDIELAVPATGTGTVVRLLFSMV